MLVLLRSDARRVVGQDEDGHLELVVADIRVRVLRHLERLLPHEHGTGLSDRGVHVGSALEGREVWVETVDAAALIRDEPVE